MTEIDDEAVYAEHAESHNKAPRAYPPGRICDEPFCGTILSIYNSATSCACHSHGDGAGHRVHRARRRQPVRAA